MPNKPVADPIQAKMFHAYRHTTGEILKSEDGGKSFKPIGNPGVRAYSIVAVPDRESDLWIPAGRAGIIRFHQGAHEKIPVFHCGTLGFGRALSQGEYPTLFIWGRPLEADPQGIYRSTDIGKTWLRVDDDSHQYGGLGNGNFVKGDMNVFGRVYRSSPGRGIPFGTPAN